MNKTATALAAALLFVSLGASQPSYGDVPKLDTIRVGIFLDVPNKYELDTAAATFSAAGGLQVGLRQPAGVQPLFRTEAGRQIRLTLDDYKPKLLVTADFGAALSAVKRLSQLGGTGLLTSLVRNGSQVYEVLEGSYGSAAEAKAAGDKFAKDAAIAALTGGAKPGISGPLYLEAGSFATEADARTAAQSFASSGADAFPAVKQTSGGVAYTVLIGAEADPDALNADKTKAEQAGNGIPVKQTDPAAVYLPIRDDHTVTGSDSVSMPLYSIPQAGAKVWLSTGSPTGIKLTERYGRSYRGQFEVSGFNKKLAVINEVPFEQYLYSVVGAEMPASWPAEALKAQAVAARTYAIYQGFGFQVAHVVDTTLSQAYNGMGSEKPATIAAVDATNGEVAMYNGKAIETVFSANAGGATADAKEIWGTPVPYLTSVTSPDQTAEQGLYHWYRVVLPSGVNGYIREDLLEDTGEQNPAGLPLLRVKGDGVKVRPLPVVQDSVPLVATVNKGTVVAELEKRVESNQMSWIRGPFTPDQLLSSLKGKTKTPVSGPINTLEISAQGPSGRATEILANGSRVDVKYPDLFRSAFGGLPSTRFQIDETARMTILGAGQGNVSQRPADGGTLAAAGSGGQSEQLDGPLYILNGEGVVRAATTAPSFRFIGNGEGHGVGLSQYGALGLANSGYDYKYILQYYYKDVTIAKE